MFELERVVKDSEKLFEATLYRLINAVHADGAFDGKLHRQFKRTERQIAKLIEMLKRR